MSKYECWAVILAAGQGSRLAGAGLDRPKQYLCWQNLPLWMHSAKALAALPMLRGLVFVFPQADVERLRLELTQNQGEALRLPWRVPWRITQGGVRRQDSVLAGLNVLPPACTHVLIHDAARPFVSPALAARVLAPLIALPHEYSRSLADAALPEFALGAEKPVGVVPGLPLKDTVKEVTADGQVSRTLPRAALRAVQTPQAFVLENLRAAHARAASEGWDATDDAMLVEMCGGTVLVVEGDVENAKLTGPEDLALLALKRQIQPYYEPCSGWGYDVHRFGGSRPLRLGGLEIPGGFTVEAHSDGDTLLHALIDAILGCLGAGDIGGLFPDSDPAYDNISSCILLERVLDLTREAKLRLTHVDLTVVAQKPKLAPHALNIRRNVARMLDLEENHVNFKATTEEGLGFTGQGQGLKAMAQVSALREATCGMHMGRLDVDL